MKCYLLEKGLAATLALDLFLALALNIFYLNLDKFFPTYFNVSLIAGAARIFPTSNAATGSQTHVSSVAPLLRDLNPGPFTD